ncbi:transposase [Lactiplantibacillus pentosus]|uniref:transposase n=1 Tax=Lactiplantibacillus pentosus TaxID=1589 RepID=UPI001EB2E0C7
MIIEVAAIFLFYQQLIPNARVVDQFHVVQMDIRSLNKIRIQAMKTRDRTDETYKYM